MSARLDTERLVLREPELRDAPEIERLISVREVAEGLLRVPYPYPQGGAEEWLRTRTPGVHRFAIERRADGAVVGVISITVDDDQQHAEAGYWIGVPYWGHGYATEALRAVLRYAFDEVGLRRVFAHVFATNPASARVLEKAGMQREGRLRQHFLSFGAPVDADVYGILRGE